MSNKSTIGIFVALFLGIMALFFYMQKNKKPALLWTETYEEKKENKTKNPYDVSLLRECLSGSDFKTIDLDKKISETLTKDIENTNYVFIGEAIKGDSADWKALLEYAKKGNTVFWASEFFPKKFLNQIKEEQDLPNDVPEEDALPMVEESEETAEVDADSQSDSSNQVQKRNNQEIYDNYYSESLTMPFYDSTVNVQLFLPDSFIYKSGYFDYFGQSKNESSWTAFNSINVGSFKYPIQKLGVIDSLMNCFSMDCGKGRIIFHSNPILFTNVELAEKDAMQYSSLLFSLLKKGDIYWDKHNRIKEDEARYADAHEGNAPMNKHQKTPLQYILSNNALSWAWYGLLAMGILFLIFSAKRKQRVVPVLAENTNTSLAFIQSIGRLYFNKQEHTSLSRTQYKQWQWFVRQRYSLKTNILDVVFTKKLALSSGIEQEKIQHIIDAGIYIEMYEVGQGSLIQFHKELEYFYKKCK